MPCPDPALSCLNTVNVKLRHVPQSTAGRLQPPCVAGQPRSARTLFSGDEEESDDDSLMPAVNLSNRLNPNNVHFDRQLAAQYKRMSKHEKEALWAADRARQHQLRELTELSQMAGLSAAELTQLTELTQVSKRHWQRLHCWLAPTLVVYIVCVS